VGGNSSVYLSISIVNASTTWNQQQNGYQHKPEIQMQPLLACSAPVGHQMDIVITMNM